MSSALSMDPLVEAVPEDGRRLPALRDFVESSRLRSLVIGTSKDPNPKLTVLLVSPDDGRPVFAIKAPLTDAAARAVDAERRVLCELALLGLGKAAPTIPRFLGWTDFDGRRAMVTTALEGTPLRTIYLRWRHAARENRVARDFAAVEAWLEAFQAATARDVGPIDMDAGVWSRLRSRYPMRPELDRALKCLSEVYVRLRAHDVSRTSVHGDLWFGNVLIDQGGVSGILDWECGSAKGEPVRDLVRFPLAYALYLDRRTRPGGRVAGHPGLRAGRWGAGVEYAFNGSGWFPTLFRRFLGRGLARLGAPSSLWRDAALAGLAEIAAFADDPEFGRLHLELFRRLCTHRQDEGGMP